MPETLVDAQAAAEKRVHALAGSLRTALAPIQEQLDNPVPGAHCSCLKPRMFNEFGDTWTVKDAEKECRLFCEERLDWADAQRQRLCRELLEDPIKADLASVDAGIKAKPVHRGVLAGVTSLLADKDLRAAGLIDGDGDIMYGPLPDLKECLLESKHLQDESDAYWEDWLARRRAEEQLVAAEVERRCRAGQLEALTVSKHLKAFCQEHAIKSSGKKDVLIGRIQAYFADTPEGRAQRQKVAAKQAQEEQTQQRCRERRARQKERRAREEEEEAQCEVGECCDAPDFDFSQPPAGMTTFPDGGVAEDWRCRSCGKIPPRPYGISKGAIQEEFSDEDSYSEYYY